MTFLPAVLRILLIATLVSMAFLAALFLRQRQLSLAAYLGWGLLALLVPGLGPFLVILVRPGRQRLDDKPGGAQ